MREMSDDEAEKLIADILAQAGQPLTTREIEAKVNERGTECPDAAARFLNKMRFRGLIKGELSIEKRGWIWWK